MKTEIAKAIVLLTAEYDLPAFSREKIDMWMRALSKFPPGSVMRATENHLQTCRFKPQLADIVAGCKALVGGEWLGAEEAWARMPKSEMDSAMLTDEIAQAIAIVAPMMANGDYIAARMAFKDAYTRLVDQAKIDGRAPVYFPSFGTDKAGAATMLANAVRAGQLTFERAAEVKPEFAQDVAQMVGVRKHPLLGAPNDAAKQKVKELLLSMRKMPSRVDDN